MARIFIIITLLIFGTIGAMALFKDKGGNSPTPSEPQEEVIILSEAKVVEPTPPPVVEAPIIQLEEPVKVSTDTKNYPLSAEELPKADRVERLFTPSANQLPIVETIIYKSRVPWLKGRPAWISDYAAHYGTSRHFIARSLHGKGNYAKHEIANGNKFNVLKPEKDIEFYLLIDTSRSKLWLYAIDKDTNERILIKDYVVGLGRLDESKESGMLTPLGTYTLGNRIATYEPNTMGHYNGKKVEMIRIYGTRWIPFEKEVANATAPAKGFGIHGVPFVEDAKTGNLVEDLKSLGAYCSDGCVRLASPDIEEIYAIIVSKPATVELVSDFHQAKLPGREINP